MIERVRIYTDGGSRGNPGPAASGAVIKTMKDGKEGEVIAEVSRYLGKDTNNQAEYTAIIIGLERAKELGAKEVEVVMDSELAVKQLNGLYKVKNPGIAKRFMEIWQLKSHFKKISFRHVRREYNKEADALVNFTLDRAKGK
ncbi:MAG: Ribonuclease H [Candidatus Uhrbacteria bacterium GW2011_GWA2_53_10]|uniref:Ribonuclease H n=1 Tax=Candidatus Uhrbacteria bacterium GW2011_GWA2_53_10 TaxID=1618980 RepID=A0A0G1ZWW3_9BACT|nr:MAG: Ribonuclease H [Candidatus Uhrbacteria bacterium GW2011_GWA2_53_10]